MKGKTKQQKGITLIALIITIVVLLILAAVAISSIQNDGILHYAQNAADSWNKAQENEQAMLGDYLNHIANMGSSSTSGTWTQDGTTVTNGKDTLTVGDYVNYVSGVAGYDEDINDDGVNDGWRVLGAKDGQILLLSTNFVASDYKLYGADDYFNGISKLDGVCADYGNGEYADSSKTRSINVDDINRVTGYNPRNTGVYDPTQSGTGTPYADGYIHEYENEVTYTLTYDDEIGGDVINATGSNGATGTDDGDFGYFVMPNGTELTSDMTEGINVTSTYYQYKPDTLTNEYRVASGTTAPGLATNSEAYYMLFKSPTSTTTDILYWLGSSFVTAYGSVADFGVHSVYSGCVGGCALWDSTDGAVDGDDACYGVRAVVSLQSDVKLTSSGSNYWTLSK